MIESRQGGKLASSAMEDGQYEPEQINNHSGTGEAEVSIKGGGGGDGGDLLIKVDEVISKFNKSTSLKESSRVQYQKQFEKFARDIKLESLSKRTLAGIKGKELLLEHIKKTPLRSRRFVASFIRKVWEMGLELPWPLNKDIIGKLPRVQEVQAPDNDVVKSWKESMGKEPDLYFRLSWLFIAETGLRPSHIGHLRWKHIILKDGNPYYIKADGDEADFKSYSKVRCWICPVLREALFEWMQTNPQLVKPEGLVLPWRTRGHIIQPNVCIEKDRLLSLWHFMRSRWKLPYLTPKLMRHWVAAKALRGDMLPWARAFMQGHDIDREDMGQVYSREADSECLIEQERVFPDGPLAVLDPPKVEMIKVAGLTEEEVRFVLELKAKHLLPAIAQMFNLKVPNETPDILTK